MYSKLTCSVIQFAGMQKLDWNSQTTSLVDVIGKLARAIGSRSASIASSRGAGPPPGHGHHSSVIVSNFVQYIKMVAECLFAESCPNAVYSKDVFHFLQQLMYYCLY